MISAVKFFLIKWFFTLCRLIPLKRSQQIGSTLGRCLMKFNKKRVHIVKCNLKACFPNQTDKEREKLTNKIAEETGKWIMESAHVWFGKEKDLIRHLKVKNPDLLRKAYNKQNGVVIILPHLGNWEMINFYLPQNYPSASMYKPLSSNTMEKIVLGSRTQAGAEMFAADSRGVRQALKHLKKGKVLIVLSDHLPSREAGVYAPFFGNPALTGKLTHTLVKFNQSEAIMASVLRQPNGEGFELEFHPITGMQDTNNPVEAATYLNKSIEEAILIAPEQYQWVYTRFDKQPKGSSNIYRLK